MPARRLPFVLLHAALSASLVGCNAGPFMGTAHVADASGKRVWVGDGSRAKLSADMRWDFVKGRSSEHWRSSRGRSWHPQLIAHQCSRAVPVSPERSTDERGRTQYVYPETRTIVCLDPVVVIAAPVPRTVSSTRLAVDGYGTAQFIKFAAGRFQLPDGYQYGSTVPDAEPLTWFSPDISPEPQPLAITEGRGTIALPEGTLRLTRRSGTYRVTWAKPE